MKHSLLTSKTIGVVFATLLATTVYSTTYSTLHDGEWANTTSLWSTNGITPCGCSPGTTSSGDIIYVNHELEANMSVSLNGGAQLNIGITGTLDGGVTFELNSCEMNILGDVNLKKLSVLTGATVNLTGSLLSLSSRMDVYGTVNIDGGYLHITGGNLEVYPSGTFNTINTGKVDLVGGNIFNSGIFNICPNCCFTTTGNWKNESTGTVSGSGSATTTLGNMQNSGVWDTNVTWCSAGSDFGMPSPEDCADATSNCTISLLPVELIKFESQTISNNDISIIWSTATEINNDYFTIYRSLNGHDWISLRTIKGVGNSNSPTEYSHIDYNVPSGMHYYRLRQTDFDGTSSFSDIISTNIIDKDVPPVAYPNPITTSDNIFIYHLVSGSGIIQIADNFGRTLEELSIPKQHQTEFQIPLKKQLSQGIYILKITQNNKTHQIRLLVN